MLKYTDKHLYHIKIVGEIPPTMNVHQVHLRHYLNKRSRAFPVCK